MSIKHLYLVQLWQPISDIFFFIIFIIFLPTWKKPVDKIIRDCFIEPRKGQNLTLSHANCVTLHLMQTGCSQ